MAVDDVDDLTLWVGQVALAIVSSVGAGRLGLGANDISLIDSETDIELVRFGMCDGGRRLSELTAFAERDFGGPRDGFWSRVLAPLAAVSKEEVVVLDRFFLAHLVKYFAELDAAGRGPESVETSGPWWLLRRLAPYPQGVKIVSAEVSDRSVEELEWAADRAWAELGGGGGQVTFVVARA